MQLLALFGRK